mmetsp:Transcript_25815/g.76454  ORF Transcript_25815/g.76454 Transcript_25815/m.76454 type:complete len:235 (-) Transcript_25815:1537-2241(-)
MSCRLRRPGSSLRWSRARRWSARRAFSSLSVAFSWTVWLTTIVFTGTFSFFSEAASRQLSLIAMMVGMVTMTNSVVSLFRKRSRASARRDLSSSSFTTAGSFSTSLPVKNDLTAPVALDSFCRRRTIFPMDTSRNSGRVSSRKVWPVGAVSNTMRWKCAYSGSLRNCTTLLSATASSTPGGGLSISSPSCRSLSCSAMPPRPTLSSTSFNFLPPSSAATCRSSSRASSGSICIP